LSILTPFGKKINPWEKLLSCNDDNTYLNPNDSEDSYSYVEIDGVIYLPYGTQGKTITNKEVDVPDFIETLGYEIWN
jgi:hypothetical protein